MSDTKTRPMSWMGQQLDNYTEVLKDDRVVDVIEHYAPGCDIHRDPETGKEKG